MIAEIVAAPPVGAQHMVLRPPEACLLLLPGEGHVFSLDGVTWWRYDGDGAPPVIIDVTAARSSWVRTTRPDLVGILPAGARL